MANDVGDGGRSYRRILKSTFIVGGSSVLNIFIGLARTKVAAVLLGPAGIGLVGLLTSLLGTATTVAGMGIGTAGTRQVAESAEAGDLERLARARRALFWLGAVLACVGALAVFLLRDVLAQHILGNPALSDAVGWLALGVAFTVGATAQGALLRGMRRIQDMARVSVYSAIVNTIVGAVLLWQFGKSALIAYILIGPFLVFAFGRFYTSRLPKPEKIPFDRREMAHQWRMLLRVGVAFMGAGLAATLVQLWIRVEIRGNLGAAALGQYEAAWTIATQYLALVLTAMGADYYPRLTGIIHDKPAASRLVNEQTEIAVLLSTPLIIAILGMAPWITTILYTAAFSPAVSVIRWQMVGNVLQVASWPLGFVIVAAGDARTFFWTQTSSLALMGGLVMGLTPVFGLPAAGMASLACYAYLLPVVYLVARRRLNFSWTGRVAATIGVSFLICAAIMVLSTLFSWGVYLSVGVALLFGLYALGRISQVTGLKGPMARLGTMVSNFASRFRRH